jgi:hypothetical protein
MISPLAGLFFGAGGNDSPFLLYPAQHFGQLVDVPVDVDVPGR